MDIEIRYSEAEFAFLDRELANLDEAVALIHQEGSYAAAQVVATRARILVPVRRGYLQRSIRAYKNNIRVGDRRHRKVIRGARAFAGGRGARHALLIERGTVHMAAQPYMVPAAKLTASKQIKVYRSAALRALNKYRLERGLS